MAEVASLVLKVTEEGVVLTSQHLRQLAGAAKEADTSFTGLAKQIAGFTTGAQLAVQAGQWAIRTIKDLAVESITLAASFEKSRMTWGVLVGDMDRGSAVFDKLYAFAAKTPMSFEGVNQAATTLKGFGVEVNNLIPTMSRLGDIAMGDDAKLQRIALVYGQVIAKGKADTRDLWQFVDAGVPVVQMLAQQMGVTAAEVLKLTEQGKVGFGDLDKAITGATSAGGQFYELGEKVAESISGKWMTAQDEWKKQLAAFGESVLPMVTTALDAATAAMNRWNAARGGSKDAVKTVSLGGLVSSGDALGAANFVMTNAPKDIDMVYSALALAEKANPLPTAMQALALKAAQDALAFIQATQRAAAKAAEAASQGGPASSLASSMGGFPGSVYFRSSFSGLPGANADLFAWARAQNVEQAWRDESMFGPESIVGRASDGYQPGNEDTGGYKVVYGYQPGNEDTGGIETKRDRWGFIEGSKGAKEFADSLKSLNALLAQTAQTTYLDAFRSLGEAMAGGAEFGESFADAMASVGMSLLDALPQLLLTAGLEAMFAKNYPLGLSLIASSGFVALGDGVAHSAEANALGGVYSSPSLHAYVNGVYDSPRPFAFAKGGAFGWEGMQAFARGGVFGEAGPEAIMPLRRGADGSLGVKASGTGVSVVVNNLASGAQATASETMGPGGERQIIVTVESIVKAGLASGRFDGAMSRYGARPQGRRT